MQDVINAIKRRMKATNWDAAGNCFEAAVAAGILLSINDDSNVRLVSGTIRHVKHWWIDIDGEICDPTSEQFNPPLKPTEYECGRFDGMDLHNLACWMGLTGIT